MKPITVYLNSHFNLIETTLAAASAAGDLHEYRFICTYRDSSSIPLDGDPQHAEACMGDALFLPHTGKFVREPHGLTEDEYAHWCVHFAHHNRVKVFMPGRKFTTMSRLRRSFNRAGVVLVVASDSDTMAKMDDKVKLYETVDRTRVHVPDYHVVRDLAGFEAAFSQLRSKHAGVCFKPAVSIFGYGFRQVTDGGNGLQRLFSGDTIKLTLDDARYVLSRQASFRDLMVMQYLPGFERSVDCLAHKGKLIAAVVRRKNRNGTQLLECNEEVERQVRAITVQLRLNGVYNVQFKDGENGLPYLLEINPRMSGGLPLSCLSGTVLPYWAIRLAAGTAKPSDVPTPRTGITVAEVSKAVIVEG